MYWTEGGTQKLRSATLDGQDIRDVVVKSEVQEAPRDVAVDSAQGKVYWTALCCGLRRADLNGENEEVVANAEFASGVLVDGDALYWADWMNGQILRRGPSGEEEPIVTGLASPVDVALDAGSRMIYWSDVGNARTQRAQLDGSGVQALNMSWAIMNTYGMAIDTSDRKLYMTDFQKTGDFTGSSSDYAGRIIRTNLDGSDAEVLVSEPGMSMPYGVAVDPESAQVYWTDRKAGRIQRLTLKCPAGTLEVASRMNTSSIKVVHGAADHGSSIQVPCPEGYNGTMKLACNNNKFSVNAGKCGKRCAAGSVPLEMEDSTFALEHPSLDDREVLVSDCPGHLVGSAEFLCQDGKTLLSNAGCRRARSCPAGQFLLGHALVEHSAMDHGIMEPSSCPEGFEGQYFLQCQDGSVVQKHGEFSCRATCDTTGSLWVDDGAVEVSHGKMIEGGTVKVVCPKGSAGQGVYLSCDGGYINVTESTCQRSSFCPAGVVTSGSAEVSHDNLDDKELLILACPDGFSGSLNIVCRKGEVEVDRGSCRRGCAAGLVAQESSEGGEPLNLAHGMLADGELVHLDCPDGYAGRPAYRCQDGNVSRACGDSDAENAEGTENEHEAKEEGECACRLVSPTAGTGDMATTEGLRSELPVAAMAAAVTAAVLLLVFTTGLLRHRFLKRRAMAAAVAAAVGDMRDMPALTPVAPPAPSCALGLPKVGSFSGRSARSTASAPTAASSHTRARTDECIDVVIDQLTLPPYWATRDGIHIFPDPNRIAEVQQLMNDTWRSRYTRDRWLVAGAERVPLGCRVANVLRVENHRAFTRYANYKDGLRMKRPGPCALFRSQTSDRINLLDDDVNERYLFHGTNPESAQSIARDLFKMDRAGSCAGSMFGRGIYLAENASKSDEYAKEGAGVYLGLCAMLLCRCAMGEVLTVSEAGDTQETVRAGGYDSVCGDRLAAAGTFREMVFFNEEAVYAEFIVIYTRVFE
ncbi:Lrp4 [Symbiodinium natans]|uniref:Poly [ADP-ribose] polymerase n=1 Tax=Symbiodinium natans TaxID=878477 RepID=A0A812HR70_9DINO|nr:Lrp4 [Symbiodinium natans]